MSYANLEIIRPLYGMQKKISSEHLKAGDRFIYSDSKGLMFKTNQNQKMEIFFVAMKKEI